MNYESGGTVHDPLGNEWMIGNTWDHEDSICMFLVGVSGEVAGQFGGLRVAYEEGGLTANVR